MLSNAGQNKSHHWGTEHLIGIYFCLLNLEVSKGELQSLVLGVEAILEYNGNVGER